MPVGALIVACAVIQPLLCGGRARRVEPPAPDGSIRIRLISIDPLEKSPCRNPQRVRQLADRSDARLASRPLDLRDMGHVKVGRLA